MHGVVFHRCVLQLLSVATLSSEMPLGLDVDFGALDAAHGFDRKMMAFANSQVPNSYRCATGKGKAEVVCVAIWRFVLKPFFSSFLPQLVCSGAVMARGRSRDPLPMPFEFRKSSLFLLFFWSCESSRIAVPFQHSRECCLCGALGDCSTRLT